MGLGGADEKTRQKKSRDIIPLSIKLPHTGILHNEICIFSWFVQLSGEIGNNFWGKRHPRINDKNGIKKNHVIPITLVKSSSFVNP